MITKLLTLLAAVVAAVEPWIALAQQPRTPVVGFLGISNPERAAREVPAMIARNV
jgi:hypothetical protein